MSIDKQENQEQNAILPPFYDAVVPLSSKEHEKLKLEGGGDYSFAKDSVAIVLAVDEFPAAERDYPIVFSESEPAMPVALMGVPGQRNQFITKDGQWINGAYIPAYIRRYPFILAKLQPETDALALCFDPGSKLLVEGEEGNLFVGDDPSEQAKAVLQFCESYEGAIRRTEKFVKELRDLDLLMDAQANVHFAGQEPTVFRGFQIVSEEKYRSLGKEQMQRLVESGALPLIHAHLFSLKNIERLFARHFGNTDEKKSKRGKAA